MAEPEPQENDEDDFDDEDGFDLPVRETLDLGDD